jgi:cell division protein FtsB
MRWLTLLFVALIALLQYPLWLGKGSWLRVWDLSQQIDKQKDANDTLKARNDTLDAEVRDLKQGYAAIEERARSELGMVKQDEVFYQVMDGSSVVSAAPTKAPAPAAQQSLPSAPKPAAPRKD